MLSGSFEEKIKKEIEQICENILQSNAQLLTEKRVLTKLREKFSNCVLECFCLSRVRDWIADSVIEGYRKRRGKNVSQQSAPSEPARASPNFPNEPKDPVHVHRYDMDLAVRRVRGSRKRKRTTADDDSDNEANPAAKSSSDEICLDDDVGLSHNDAQEQTFTTYRPPTCSHACLVPHPDELVETASLSSVPEPKVVNKLRLPSKTLLDGLLTCAQAEVCLRAVAQHELRLPNGHRSGFFMGDGAGVGKGRQQAAIIFHNFLHGRKKAIWLSVSADLIEDARRDIADIGASEFVQCHSLKAHKIGQRLLIDSGIIFATYSLLVVFATFFYLELYLTLKPGKPIGKQQQKGTDHSVVRGRFRRCPCA